MILIIVLWFSNSLWIDTICSSLDLFLYFPIGHWLHCVTYVILFLFFFKVEYYRFPLYKKVGMQENYVWTKWEILSPTSEMSKVICWFDLNIFYCMIFMQKDEAQVLKNLERLLLFVNVLKWGYFGFYFNFE